MLLDQIYQALTVSLHDAYDLAFISTSGSNTSARICTVPQCANCTEPLLYWSLLTLTSSRVLGSVRTKAQLLFCQVCGACRCTRWKTCWLLLNCSLMRHWEMFSFLWRFVLIVRQVALHRLWDFMNEWVHYQYEKPLKYLVLTYFYLQGGKHHPLLWGALRLSEESIPEFAGKQPPKRYRPNVLQQLNRKYHQL